MGGWVRDYLSGLTPKELDIATDLKPDEVKAIFPRSIMVGEKYGTVRVRIEESGEKDSMWEVTTLREDGGYGDGRRPDNVFFGTNIEEDLARRDFTINSMAIDESGSLIDPHGGITDLESEIVRCVGDSSERIGEDGLRIIRAFRFLDNGNGGLRSLDADLSNAISSNLETLNNISRERIWSELKLILSGTKPSEIVRLMQRHGLIEKILKGIETTSEITLSRRYCVNLALICSIDKSDGGELSDLLKERLRLSREEADSVKFLHDRKGVELDISNGSARRFRVALPKNMQEEILDYLACLGEDVSRFKLALRDIGDLGAGNSPLVDGNLLSIRTGLKPGKRLGRLKAWLHRIQIEEDILEKEELLSRLVEMEWENSEPEDWPVLSWP